MYVDLVKIPELCLRNDLTVDDVFSQLTGDVPLELVKAAVLLRRLVVREALRSKPPWSDYDDAPTSESLESDSDDPSTPEPLQSERDADHKVLILLASVCRHWCTTIQKRNASSRQQLCLTLHG